MEEDLDDARLNESMQRDALSLLPETEVKQP